LPLEILQDVRVNVDSGTLLQGLSSAAFIALASKESINIEAAEI
jgi:hypothetical protein